MLERVAGRAGGDNAVLCSSVQFSWHKFINPALSPAAPAFKNIKSKYVDMYTIK